MPSTASHQGEGPAEPAKSVASSNHSVKDDTVVYPLTEANLALAHPTLTRKGRVQSDNLKISNGLAPGGVPIDPRARPKLAGGQAQGRAQGHVVEQSGEHSGGQVSDQVGSKVSSQEFFEAFAAMRGHAPKASSQIPDFNILEEYERINWAQSSEYENVSVDDTSTDNTSVDDGSVDDDLPIQRPISPKTFCELSQGYERWDAGHVRDPDNVLAASLRVRPEGRGPNRDHFPYYLTRQVRQFDIVTGEEISPLYDVPTNPSAIYTPPGVGEGASANVSKTFSDMYRRMAPQVVKDLRDHQAGITGTGVQPAGTDERYSATEAYRAVNDPRVGPPAGDRYQQFLADKYRLVAEQEASNEAARKSLADQKAQLAALTVQRGHVSSCAAIVRDGRARAERKKQAELERVVIGEIAGRAGRADRVRQHVREHIRDVQDKLRAARERSDEYKRQAAEVNRQIQYLEVDILEQCFTLGHNDPEFLYSEAQRIRETQSAKHRHAKDKQKKSVKLADAIKLEAQRLAQFKAKIQQREQQEKERQLADDKKGKAKAPVKSQHQERKPTTTATANQERKPATTTNHRGKDKGKDSTKFSAVRSVMAALRSDDGKGKGKGKTPAVFSAVRDIALARTGDNKMDNKGKGKAQA